MSRSSGTFVGDPGMRGNGPSIDGMVTLKIDNIPFDCTVEELRYAFQRCGELGDVYIPRHIRSGNPRGFAFVRFLHQRDADHAVDRMDGERVGGRQLRIQYAKRRRPESESHRSYGGGYDRGDRRRGRSRSCDRRRSRSRSYERRRRRSPSRSRSRSHRRRSGRPSHSPKRKRSRSPRSRSRSRRARTPSRSRSPPPHKSNKDDRHQKERRMSDAEPHRVEEDTYQEGDSGRTGHHDEFNGQNRGGPGNDDGH